MAVYMGNKKINKIAVHINETGINPSDATLNSGSQMLEGVIGYGKAGKVIGTIPSLEAQTITPTESEQSIAAGQYLEGTQAIGAIPSTYVGSEIVKKSAQTYIPSTIDQTINAGQYLDGAQTIKGDTNLVNTNIVSTATIFGVQGSVVTQDYYTGNTDPSADLGKDGDLYFKRE